MRPNKDRRSAGATAAEPFELCRIPPRSLTLIGMPGSGKSAIGKIMASRLRWAFVDTDKVIEKRYGKPLQALIDEVGDQSFRRFEEEAVLSLAESERTVISTGGSVVYSETAMRHLATISTIVFLDASMEAIRRHIRFQAPRGIIGMKEGGLEALYEERLPLYRYYAALIIEMDSQTPEEAAHHVLTELCARLPIH